MLCGPAAQLLVRRPREAREHFALTPQGQSVQVEKSDEERGHRQRSRYKASNRRCIKSGVGGGEVVLSRQGRGRIFNPEGAG